MIIARIGQLLNAAPTTYRTDVKGVGFCIISAALPKNTRVSTDASPNTSFLEVRRGEVIAMTSKATYNFTMPQTWIGSLNSAEPYSSAPFDYQGTGGFDADINKGYLYAVFFQTVEEMRNYKPLALVPVNVVVSKIDLDDSADVGSACLANWTWLNIDYENINIRSSIETPSIYTCWQICEHNFSTDEFPKKVFGYITTASANILENGYFDLNARHALTLVGQKVGGSSGDDTDTAILAFRFSGNPPGNVLSTPMGRSVFLRHAVLNAASDTYDLRTGLLNTAGMWAIYAIGAAAATSSQIRRMLQNPDSGALQDAGSNILASAAHGAGVTRATLNTGGQTKVVRFEIGTGTGTFYYSAMWEF